MGFFDWFKRNKKADEIPALKLERPGIGTRIAKAGMRKYTVQMVMEYEGKPLRKFDVILKARSRDHAAFLANKNVSISVISARQQK